ncbi:MAG TPA: ATP-binding cassette domain-containing protein [Bacteroidota bacterium]|nr:ATP-binding cassette domain-containing protein [Bacteroidota bacterium]
MLNVVQLRKNFSSIRAVDGVSFDVQRGEIFGLLGPNGAGKTTTIRMVLNILEPDGGEITYEGRRFSEHVRDIVGYLPEERGLYKKNKLWDTVMYFAQLRGMQPGVAKAEAYRWLQRFGLLAHKDRKVEELSKGNQQKVQFIVSIIHDPLLIVLDEPFSGLDPVNQILFKDIFLELKQRGKAVIFSTHQMDQAEKLSDRLCLINRGKVVLGGTVRDVKKQYGKNTLHLEFSGDGTFMQTLPGVRRAFMYPNSAELELEDGVTVQSLLVKIIDRVEVRKFELLEPSLHSIFIQIVGGVAAPPPREVAA